MKTLKGSYTGQEKLEYNHVGFSLFFILFETWCCQVALLEYHQWKSNIPYANEHTFCGGDFSNSVWSIDPSEVLIPN